MASVEDPVEHGLVTSLARPGGNITGLSFQARNLPQDDCNLLREAIPGVIRVAVLWDPANPGPTASRAIGQAAPVRWDSSCKSSRCEGE